MLKLNFSTCVLVLVSGGLLAAQTQGTPPNAAQMSEWRVNHLTTALSLNSAQQNEAKTIFGNEATSSAAIRTNLEAARKALETAIEANDTAAIATQAAQIGTLTGQETQVRATADAAFYALLSGDQQTKYKEMQSHGPGGRGPGHGFGGGDGPIPPPPGD